MLNDELPDQLTDPAVRLFRAREVHDELAADIDEARKRAELMQTASPDGRHHYLVIKWPDGEPEFKRWGALFGDILHNLRAALDNLAWQLVEHGSIDALDASRIGFPIFVKKREYEKALPRKLPGVSSEALLLVSDLQPWNLDSDKRRMSRLWLLDRLAGRDRHRLIHPLGMGLTAGQDVESRIEVRDPRGSKVVVEVNPVPGGPILTIYPPEPLKRVEFGVVDLEYAFNVTVYRDKHEADPVMIDILSLSHHLITEVVKVFNQFAPLFAEVGPGRR